MYTHTQEQNGVCVCVQEGPTPVCVYIAAVLQSQRGNKGFITGLQLMLQRPLVVPHRTEHLDTANMGSSSDKLQL